MKIQSHFVHPLLFALFPSLILYGHNMNETWPSIMVKPLTYSLILGILIWVAAAIVFRNKEKASVMTSVWLIAFFSYGHTYLFATESHLITFLPVGPHLVLLSLYLFLLLATFLFLLFYKKSLSAVNSFFTVTSIVLLVINLWNILPFEYHRWQNNRRLSSYLSTQNLAEAEVKNTNSSSYPDIYYFVFDRYGNQHILPQYFNYDNTSFIQSLEKEKFFVASQSAANYPSTFVSLSSSLNMSHLNFLSDVLGKDSSDQTVVYDQLIHHNAVTRFLKKRGYEYIHIGDSWEPTRQSELADSNRNVFLNFNEFELFIYENTLLNTLVGKVSSKQLYTGVKILHDTQKNLDYRVKEITQLPQSDAPKFVFGHFLLPHPPYLFAKDCAPLSFEEVRKRSDELGYIDQLQCANQKMSVIASEIKKHAKRPVVIIFQSDEGPYLPRTYFSDTQYKHTPNNDAYKIHAYILNAIYVSDKNDATKTADPNSLRFTPTQTPVNTFRMVFNYYFGTEYPLEENKTYVFSDAKHPYNFTEVTDLLKLE